jgi:hypothetical protein
MAWPQQARSEMPVQQEAKARFPLNLGRQAIKLTAMDLSDYEPQKEWWWVVEYSDYVRKQHSGMPRYAVIPISRLNLYRNILCKVRYSTETAANAAAIAAEGGEEILVPWEVVWWSAGYRREHPETSRFEAVCQDDIRNFWSLGAKSVWGGMSRPDAVHEAARRSSLPELWCVIPNEDTQSNGQEPYTVKAFDGLSFSEKEKVRATSDSEKTAWQAIPGIVEQDSQRVIAYEQQRQGSAITERRNAVVRQVLRFAAMIVLIAGTIWLLVTVLHWLWVHPLF